MRALFQPTSFCPGTRPSSSFTAASGTGTKAVRTARRRRIAANGGWRNSMATLPATNSISGRCENLAGEASSSGNARQNTQRDWNASAESWRNYRSPITPELSRASGECWPEAIPCLHAANPPPLPRPGRKVGNKSLPPSLRGRRHPMERDPGSSLHTIGRLLPIGQISGTDLRFHYWPL